MRLAGGVGQPRRHPPEHQRDLRPPGDHVVPSARGERNRHVRLPDHDLVPESLGVDDVLGIVRARAQPELREDRTRGEHVQCGQRGVVLPEPDAAAERVDLADRVPPLVVIRREVAAEHPGEPVPGAEAQGHVRGTVAALGVPGDPPGRPGRLHPQHVRDRARQVHAEVRQVLRAVHLVEALQREPLAAVGAGHHQHGRLRQFPGHQLVERVGHAHHVDPVLRLAGLAVDELDHREAVAAEGRLEVLRRQVHVHHPGDVTARAGHLEPEGVADLLRFLEVGAAPVQRGGAPAGSQFRQRHLGRRGDSLIGEVGDRRAPGRVVVVILVDGQHPEGHRREEGQAAGQQAEDQPLRGHHPPGEPDEDHHQDEEEDTALRFQHSDLPVGRDGQPWRSRRPGPPPSGQPHQMDRDGYRLLRSPERRGGGWEFRPGGPAADFRPEIDLPQPPDYPGGADQAFGKVRRGPEQLGLVTSASSHEMIKGR